MYYTMPIQVVHNKYINIFHRFFFISGSTLLLVGSLSLGISEFRNMPVRKKYWEKGEIGTNKSERKIEAINVSFSTFHCFSQIFQK